MNVALLKEELIDDEGFKGVIYLDHLGNRTVGVGHLITQNDHEYHLPVGTVVNAARVMELLEKDMTRAIKGAESLFEDFYGLPEDVQHVLVNMCFQMGRNGVSKFRNMRKAIEEREYKKAAAEMLDSRWAQQTPNRARRLAKIMREAQDENQED
jgi:lysozyme